MVARDGENGRVKRHQHLCGSPELFSPCALGKVSAHDDQIKACGVHLIDQDGDDVRRGKTPKMHIGQMGNVHLIS